MIKTIFGDGFDIIIWIVGLIVVSAYFAYRFFRVSKYNFSGKVEQRISGKIARIGQFNAGYRNQNSFVLYLESHTQPFYAHPNFGRSIYLPSKFVAMNKELGLTQVGDDVEIGISPRKNEKGETELIILEFKNSRLAV